MKKSIIIVSLHCLTAYPASFVSSRTTDTDLGPVVFQLYDRQQRPVGTTEFIEVFLPYYKQTKDTNRRSWNFKIKEVPAGTDYIKWETDGPFTTITFKQDVRKHSNDPIIGNAQIDQVSDITPIFNKEKIYIHNIAVQPALMQSQLPQEGRFILNARGISRKSDRRMPEAIQPQSTTIDVALAGLKNKINNLQSELDQFTQTSNTLKTKMAKNEFDDQAKAAINKLESLKKEAEVLKDKVESLIQDMNIDPMVLGAYNIDPLYEKIGELAESFQEKYEQLWKGASKKFKDTYENSRVILDTWSGNIETMIANLKDKLKNTQIKTDLSRYQ